MPALNVQASTEISTPVQRVHDALVDFTTWPTWSPWLYMEPEAQVIYTGNKGEPGHGYQWTGKKVGAGNMSLTGKTPKRINCNLQFLKPFKSTATVWFDLAEASSGRTLVTWYMDSKLPFFMFFMKDSMTGMIKADYTRGLALLKDLLEIGAVQSKTTLVGTEEVGPEPYVGYPAVSSFDQLSSSMNTTFTELKDTQHADTFTPVGNAFCLYDKMDFKLGKVSYTAAVPVKESVSVDLPLVSRVRPACRALKVVHVGQYHHLANAWALLMSEARSQKLKVSKSIAPFEYYLNDPDSTVPSELITELYLPLK